MPNLTVVATLTAGPFGQLLTSGNYGAVGT